MFNEKILWKLNMLGKSVMLIACSNMLHPRYAHQTIILKSNTKHNWHSIMAHFHLLLMKYHNVSLPLEYNHKV